MAFIKNYTLGKTYPGDHSTANRRYLNARLATHNQNALIWTKQHDWILPLDNVMIAFESGVINETDRTILSIATAFSGGFLSVNTLKGLLQLSGADVDDDRMDSSVDRLFRYQLIAIKSIGAAPRFVMDDVIISLTPYGSECAKNILGINHRYNVMDYMSCNILQLRACVATAHMVYNFLAKETVEFFSIRPRFYAKNLPAKEGGVIRPSAVINVGKGRRIYLESPRRSDDGNWKADILGKLYRYALVIDGNTPTVVLNCEDMDASKELSDFLARHPYEGVHVIFTDTISQNADFSNALYTFQDGVAQVEKLP